MSDLKCPVSLWRKDLSEGWKGQLLYFVCLYIWLYELKLGLKSQNPHHHRGYLLEWIILSYLWNPRMICRCIVRQEHPKKKPNAPTRSHRVENSFPAYGISNVAASHHAKKHTCFATWDEIMGFSCTMVARPGIAWQYLPTEIIDMILFFSCAGSHLTAIENKAGHAGPWNAPCGRAIYVQERLQKDFKFRFCLD